MTRVSARVWATFPNHLGGRIASFAFARLLTELKRIVNMHERSCATSKIF
jgi:hypothetical protein